MTGQPTTPARDDAPTTGAPQGVVGLLAALVGLGLLVATVALGGAADPAPAGLPDPGLLTRWGLPLVALASDALAVVAAGALLAGVLTMVKMRERLAPRPRRAVRVAVVAVAAWLALTVAEAWLTVSDRYATPLTDTGLDRVVDQLGSTPVGQAQLAQGAVLAVVLVGLRWVTTPRRAGFALAGTLLALVPALLTGHSASSGSHDAAVVSLVLHVLAAVLWTAGVVALWWHLAAEPHVRLRAARRFSSVAAWCFAVTAATGVLGAYVRLDGLGDLLSSGYGRAVLLKAAVLVVVGLVAHRLRGVVVGRQTARAGAFAVLTAVELSAMAAAFGLGAALSRTAPPVGEPYVSRAQSLVGGPLPPEPTFTGVLTSFTLSGVGLAVVLLGAAGYLAGLCTLRRRGDAWPVGRTIAWFLGLLAVGFATVGGLGVYSHVLFSLHMTSHMVLSMLAPVLLVMGAPITLALRALPGPDAPGGDGPRQVLVSFLNSRWSKVVTNPAFATIMFVGSLYGIYFTGVYDWLMGNHLGHALMEIHFLLAGFLYYEVLIGSAPLPKRLPHLGRLGLLLAVAPFHAFFAVSIMSMSTVIGESYYALLDRPYATDLLADQELGGSLTWALGEVPLLLVAVVLLFQWFRDDTRRAKQRDRQADRDADAELEAYNAMLTRIAENRAVRGERDPATRSRATAEDGEA